ncbi:uncharacterized protein LOC143469915 isoform X2 [Clavelina lepadiformis]|uniref:uncharacterized protein LOC143469915 isoform X2 n=1 Tax=Clavelina lepadiformis TaxID=159417 RepID=UPI00404309AE
MAQSSLGGTNMSNTSAITAVRRNRERMRRQQLEMSIDQNEELPSFAEPRRVAQRQDSLTRSIQNTLGDPKAVSSIIGQGMNNWLGTSRNSSSAVNNQSRPQQDRSRVHKEDQPNLKPLSNTVGHAAHQRQPISSASGHHRSTSQVSSADNSHSKARNANLRLNSSSMKGGSIHHSNYGTPSHPQHTQSKSASNDTKPSIPSLTSPKHSDQVSNRERIESTELPSEMEIIFKEMRMNDQPLAAIQTPQFGSEFNFIKTETKPNNSTSSTHQGGPDSEMQDSDSDSSGDEDESESDDSEEEQDDKDMWNLGTWKELEPPSTTASVTKNESSSKKIKTKNNKNSNQSQVSQSSGFKANNSSSIQSSQQRRGRPAECKPLTHLKSEQVSDPFKQRSHSSTPKVSEGNQKSLGEKFKPKVRSSSSSQRHSSPAQGRTPSAHCSSVSSNQPSKKKKDTTVVRDSSNESKKSSSKFSSTKSNSSGSRSGKSSNDAYKKTAHPSVRPKQPENIKHSSTNNRSSSPSVPASVSNLTLSSTNPSIDQRHRIGGKKMKDAERKNLVISSAESSDDELASSSSSSSENEDSDSEENVFLNARKSSSVWNSIPSTKRRTNSSSSVVKEGKNSVDHPHYQSSKGNQVVPVPAKKQSNSHKSKVKSGHKINDSRSAPSALNRPDEMLPSKPSMKITISKQTIQSNIETSKGKKSSRDSYESKPKQRKKHKIKEKSLQVPEACSASSIKQSKELRKKPKKSKRNTSPSLPAQILRSESPKRYPALWVKLHLSQLNKPSEEKNPVKSESSKSNTKCNYSKKSRAPEFDDIHGSTPTHLSAMSTGSQTEQPVRRAENVQVAVADGSSDWSPRTSSSLQKRKHPQSTNENSSSLNNHKKRRKYDSSLAAGDTTQTTKGTKQKRENAQWKNIKKEQQSNPPWSEKDQPEYLKQQMTPPPPATSQNQQRTSTYVLEPCQITSQSIISEPDSSWQEQEKLLSSYEYMKVGKRLKHEGDQLSDRKTKRTKVGESLRRALYYFEATLCFVMNGYVLEMENESGENTPGSGNSPAGMYNQTIAFFDYILKMRPHGEVEEIAFKRLTLSCIRSQALLYLRIYKLKKDLVGKYSDILAEHFTHNTNKPNRTPSSPWRAINGQNVVSPISPAIPSPYGISVPGPSPIAGNNANNSCESIPAQINKMTSPASQNGVLMSPQIHEMMKVYHLVTTNLLQAHDKWDLAETLYAEHSDFFKTVDTLCGQPLTLYTSLRDMATYNRVILHRLRDAYLKSPRE